MECCVGCGFSIMGRRRLFLVASFVCVICCLCSTSTTATLEDASHIQFVREQSTSELARLLQQGVLPSFPIVETKYGPVRGYTNDGLRIFRGIPFAAPPIDTLRWRPPQPPSPWSHVRDTLIEGQLCVQIRSIGPLYVGSEDCLYLDVYVPEGASSESPLPVMVWIFGGGYMLGDKYEFGFYDAKNLARKKNVVIVAMNYRLAALGFISLPQLLEESGTTGNYGLQDQQAALVWVRDNILRFGGDPSRVTIFGESAGAFSVCWHLVNPKSRGLFHAAIMESGTCDSPFFFVDFDNGVKFSLEYASSLGCTNSTSNDLVSCLRSLSTAKIMKGSAKTQSLLSQYGNLIQSLFGIPQDLASLFVPPIYPLMPWGPVIDKSPLGLKDIPLRLLRSGDFSKVPLLIGTNENEGSIFVPAMVVVVPGVKYPPDSTSVQKALVHFFDPTWASRIEEAYPESDFSSQTHRFATVLRDYFFLCSSRRALRAVTSQGVPGFLYHFSYKMDFIENKLLGDYHASELYFVWDNAWPPVVHPFSKNDKTIADMFNTYWTNFAKSGNPNGNSTSSNISWPQYSQSTDQNIAIQFPLMVQAGLQREKCDFWDELQESQQT